MTHATADTVSVFPVAVIALVPKELGMGAEMVVLRSRNEVGVCGVVGVVGLVAFAGMHAPVDSSGSSEMTRAAARSMTGRRAVLDGSVAGFKSVQGC